MILRALGRRLLGLPPRRCGSAVETRWISMSDGVRLATTVIHPTGAEARTAPTVLIRSPYGTLAFPRLTLHLARGLAEGGYHVVVQDVRGRYASEGRFEPFQHEAADGADTVTWISDQSWFNGRLGLVGASYLGFAAWSALARAKQPVHALVALLGARDLHACFHPGGALSLSTALRWGVAVGERATFPARQLDFERGLRFRPAREADRVALRRTDWYREWIDHPRPDAYWNAFLPDLPASPPPVLLIAGWYDIFLGPQLADFAAVREAARAASAPEPRLVVGPWFHGRAARRERLGRGSGIARVSAAETIRFLDHHLRRDGSRPPAPGVRHFVLGANRWRSDAVWPPADAETRTLFLHSKGRANGLLGDGRLDGETPGAEPGDRFTYDPADPAPSAGGALFGEGCGPADQRAVESRADVLCYSSDPLETALEICGPVRVVLHAASSAPDTDFTAKLVHVRRDGVAINLCEGIQRCRWREGGDTPLWLEPDEAVRLEIELWSTSCRLPARSRLRLEISSSSFPRFDRNANTRTEPALASPEESAAARQLVLHDSEHPSQLTVTVLDPSAKESPSEA